MGNWIRRIRDLERRMDHRRSTIVPVSLSASQEEVDRFVAGAEAEGYNHIVVVRMWDPDDERDMALAEAGR